MDWPTVTLILAILGTIVVAIIKFVPQRTVVQNTDGHKCASEQSVNELALQIEKLVEYLHLRFHDVINGVSPVTGLVNQTSDVSKTLSRIEGKLSVLLDRNPRGNSRDNDTD